MCGPAAAILAVAGAAVSTVGTLAAGSAANAQGRYAQQVANVNAQLDRKASQDALARGAIEEQRQYRRTAQLLGQQRAALAANGVEVDFGSAADLQTDTKQIGWEDANTIRMNAAREANGYEISAFNDVARGEAARAQGKAAQIKSFFDAGSTILSTASQVSSMNASRSGKTG